MYLQNACVCDAESRGGVPTECRTHGVHCTTLCTIFLRGRCATYIAHVKYCLVQNNNILKPCPHSKLFCLRVNNFVPHTRRISCQKASQTKKLGRYTTMRTSLRKQTSNLMRTLLRTVRRRARKHVMGIIWGRGCLKIPRLLFDGIFLSQKMWLQTVSFL